MAGKLKNTGPDQTVGEEIRLENLIDMKVMRKILDDFYKIARFPVAILNLEGKVLLDSHWELICTGYHRVNPETAIKCKESDTHFNDELGKSNNKYVMYKCGNGLCEAASPIIVGDRHLGNFFIGQFLLEKPDERFFIEQAQNYGFPQNEYLEALSNVPVISEDELKIRLNYLSGFAEFLGNTGLKELQRDRAEAELKERRERLEDLIKERTAELEIEITERKQVEAALKSEKVLIDDYINCMPGLFYVFDEERFVKWNHQFEIVTGYSKNELCQMYGTDFFDGPEKALVAKRMTEVFVEGVSGVEAELITKHGERIPHYFSGIRKEINGKPHLVGLGFDITNSKQAEDALRESEHKHRVLFESSRDAILILDPELGYLDCNQASLEMFGFSSKEEFLKLNPIALSPEFQPDGQLSADKAGQCINLALERGSYFWEWIHKRADGVEFPATVLATKLDLGNQILLQGTIRDITERKRTEAENERLIFDLKEALAEVKKLSGLLPICASCKKIRDDKGYWTQLESFIEKHSEALFSHGICPECAEDLYKDTKWYQDMKDEGKL